MKKCLLLLILFVNLSCNGDANLISSVMVQPNKITVIPTPECKELFGIPDFYVEYEDSELDLTHLPYSIVTIPFIVHMFPMVLRSGQTFYVDQIDADFNKSMKLLQQMFEGFYPHVRWKGKLVGREQVKYSFTQSPLHEENKKGIVSPFSNGIDSMYNSMATLGKKQQLVTLHGGDVPLSLDAMWDTVKQGCKEYCNVWGAYFSSMKSNFSRLYGHKKGINPHSL